LNWKQAQKKVNYCNKKINGEKGKVKKTEIEKKKQKEPKDVGHFLKILISAHVRAKMT